MSTGGTPPHVVRGSVDGANSVMGRAAWHERRTFCPQRPAHRRSARSREKAARAAASPASVVERRRPRASD